eukprot:5322434-Pyramimonas_sp.AAC.1
MVMIFPPGAPLMTPPPRSAGGREVDRPAQQSDETRRAAPAAPVACDRVQARGLPRSRSRPPSPRRRRAAAVSHSRLLPTSKAPAMAPNWTRMTPPSGDAADLPQKKKNNNNKKKERHNANT